MVTDFEEFSERDVREPSALATVPAGCWVTIRVEVPAARMSIAA
jgi:hypothetical protein